MKKEALFSNCKTYRYVLWRVWNRENPYAMFVGLNPSTADEHYDDPTIRRCIGYAKDWGYGGLCMTNLFAFKATKPENLLCAKDPVGPENDYWLETTSKDAGIIIVAWGNHGDFQNRSSQVIDKLPNVMCLNQNKGGAPSHPLYQRRSLKPVELARSLT